MDRLLKIRGFIPFILMIFLNAFVDLGHKIIIQNTVFKTFDGSAQIMLSAIVNALILLPFILLFTPSAYLSDKHPKNKVMRAAAWVAVAITAMITLSYYLGWFYTAFAMTFLLAIQSAIYSPSKYGYIKELVGKANLGTGNGAVQAITTGAILAGIFMFSLLFEHFLKGVNFHSPADVLRLMAPIGWVLVGLSLMELALAYRLPQRTDTDMDRVFDWQAYGCGRTLRKNLRRIVSNPSIWLSIVGLSIFWAIAQVIVATFPDYAEQTMGLTNTVVIQGMLACTGIGIVIGSLLAGSFSKNHIETGMLPVAAAGIAASLFILPTLNSVLGQSLNFLILGILGGLFIVPLNAMIQFYAGEREAGKVLAGNNLVQNIVMLTFLGLTIFFAQINISSAQLITMLAGVAVIGAVYTIYKLPQSLVRFIASVLISRRYRLTVLGFENIPASGGVLLLGNHISWIDWAIVQMASPRPIRFVMHKAIYDRWYLKGFLKFFGAIPISGGVNRSALKQIETLLNDGEVVCLFPEGSISRTGQLAQFHRGYELAAANANAVILPFYMHGLWGSRFSRSSDRLKANSRAGLYRDITIVFGKSLANTTTTGTIKKALFQLSVQAWEVYSQGLQPIPRAWIDTVKKRGNDMAMVDSIGQPLSHYRALTAAIGFSRRIKKQCPEKCVGLLLPTSTAGSITNMAGLLAAKTLVNLNYTASEQAITAAIKKADIKTVYSSRRFVDKLRKKGVILDTVLEGVNTIYLEDLKNTLGKVEMLSILLAVKWLPAALLKAIFCRPCNIDDTAAILFSSGSEGEPKGVMLSHRNLMVNLKQVSNMLNTVDEDVVMATLPLFHAFGLTVTHLMPLIEGIPMVCHPDPTDVVNVAKAIATYRATILCGTSTFLRLYTKNRRARALMLDSLRIVISGAEKLSTDVRDTFKLKFNTNIYEGYGATETSPVAAVGIPDQLDTQYWSVQQGTKPGTVGMPLPGTCIKIVDPDKLVELPTGEDGLILIGGIQVMKGYLKDNKKTQSVIIESDGIRWYNTGDKGHVDDDGFLSIVDRYSRFAKLAGEMVSLGAVEEQVRQALQQPELELVAINLPDAKKGEKIVLMLAGQGDIGDVKKILIDAQCNPLMIPAEIYSVEDVPKLGSGKTDFTAARALAKELAM